MKRIIISTMVLIFILCISIIPVLAVSYSVWAKWDGNVVNGYTNGITYTLDTGAVTLTSTGAITDTQDGTTTVEYWAELCRHRALFDKEFGIKSQTATTEGYSNSCSWNADIQSSEYYLIFSKVDRFVNTIKVNGTLSQ